MNAVDPIDLTVHSARAPRIAVVHEWFTKRGGSEQVFQAIASCFPTADLYCLTRDPEAVVVDDGRTAATTFLDRNRLRDLRHLTLPVMPVAWKSLDRPAYDLVISSSHAFSRYFYRPGDRLHLCYVHAPMRYAWDPEIDPRTARLGPMVSYARAALRRVDSGSTRGVTHFAANSTAVAHRVRSYYRRNCSVIYPPVDTEQLTGSWPKQDYLVAGGRFIDYKRLDIAISVASEVGLPLRIFGNGPLLPKFRDQAATARVPVTFHLDVSELEKAQLLGSALALIFPSHEDFGIIPVESLAAGTPFVGLDRGGVVDIKGTTTCAQLATGQTVPEFIIATKRLLADIPSRDTCQRRAVHFSSQAFARRMLDWTRLALRHEHAVLDGLGAEISASATRETPAKVH